MTRLVKCQLTYPFNHHGRLTAKWTDRPLILPQQGKYSNNNARTLCFTVRHKGRKVSELHPVFSQSSMFSTSVTICSSGFVQRLFLTLYHNQRIHNDGMTGQHHQLFLSNSVSRPTRIFRGELLVTNGFINIVQIACSLITVSHYTVCQTWTEKC